jgi:hypothetical protein
MPTKQISAVDWLANEIAINEKLLKLAKEIEKQNIVNAYHVGYSRAIMPKDYNAQEYYEQNFNKETI